MTAEIGLDTSYPITIPSATDTADIQSALRLVSYGIAGTPTSDSQITSNSVFGKMALLAPKAAPAFTGNGSIAGNFQIGGNLTVAGSIDTLAQTNAVFKDKTIILSSGSTSDAESNGAGIQVSGSGPKTFLFTESIGWNSNQNINLATGRTFKINSTDVLSSTSVLGILGTNIAKKDSANAFTAANTFSGGTQTINGVTIDTSGGISRDLVSNEWVPVVVHTPTSPIQYSLSGYTYLGTGETTMIEGVLYSKRIYRFSYSGDAPLLPGQEVYVPTSGGATIFVINESPSGSITATTLYFILGNWDISPYNYMYDYYDSSIQQWKSGGYSGTVQAQVTRSGTVESLNGFNNIGKTYHTNAAVPRVAICWSSGNVFLDRTESNDTTNWSSTAAGNATGSSTTKLHAVGATMDSYGSTNMGFSTANGMTTVLIPESGTYQFTASATQSTSVASARVFIYKIGTDGVTKTVPTYASNLGGAHSTATVTAIQSFESGERVGIAIKGASVTVKADTTLSLSGFLIG